MPCISGLPDFCKQPTSERQPFLFSCLLSPFNLFYIKSFLLYMSWALRHFKEESLSHSHIKRQPAHGVRPVSLPQHPSLLHPSLPPRPPPSPPSPAPPSAVPPAAAASPAAPAAPSSVPFVAVAPGSSSGPAGLEPLDVWLAALCVIGWRSRVAERISATCFL